MKINTLNRRKQLKPRGWPYWEPVGKGKAIGFYPTETGGSWRARIRTPSGKQQFTQLGGDLDSEYDDMLKLAHAWFEEVSDVEDVNYNVKQCVKEYVAHLLVEKGSDPSTRAKQLLEKHLVAKLGDLQLSALTTGRFKAWRDGLVRVSDDAEDVRKSKDSANRILSQAKAAFNLAYRSGRINSDTAWKRVQAFKAVGVARTLFLTDEQVQRLLAKARGQLLSLSKAAVLTGARYGELAGARVRDFDKRHHTLRLDGKTGVRTAYLSDDTARFFRELTKDRLPDAWLLVKDDGEPWGTSHHSRAFRALVKKAKLPADTVFYSLRHYHISKALLAGLPVQVIAENTGTSVRMIEKHYGKFMPKDRRAMLNQVALL